jgi:hypothetical protein
MRRVREGLVSVIKRYWGDAENTEISWNYHIQNNSGKSNTFALVLIMMYIPKHKYYSRYDIHTCNTNKYTYKKYIQTLLFLI